MKNISCKIIFMMGFLLSFSAQALDYIIFSVGQELPMGYEDEQIRKNYYVNLGQNQGLQDGTVLNVHRIVSKLNPYDNQKRINYSVKIGELQVLHTEENSAIALLKNSLVDDQKTPIFEIKSFMIGDKVSVKVD